MDTTTRIGVLCSIDHKEFFEKALRDFSNVILTGYPLSLTQQFIEWRQTNTAIVVLDDSLFLGYEELEDELIKYAQESNLPAIRFILFSDGARDIEDSFFYRLVSDAEIKDVLFASLYADAEEALKKKIETPTSLAEVNRWKTDDKKKRQRNKGGLFSRKKEKKPKEEKKAKKKKRGKLGKDDDLEIKQVSVAPDESYVTKTEKMPRIDEQILAEEEPQESDEEEQVEPDLEEEVEEDNKEELDEEDLSFDYYAQVNYEDRLSKELEEGSSESSEVEEEFDHEAEKVVTDKMEATSSMSLVAPQSSLASLEPENPNDQIIAIPTPKNPVFEPKDFLTLNDVEAKLPSAVNVIAVAGVREGVGCTHLSIALGSALASLGLSVSVVFHDRSILNRLFEVVDETQIIDRGFTWRGCDFFNWFEQTNQSRKYDFVVCDCDVIDFRDDSKSSPLQLFRNAQAKICILSGAPWDLRLTTKILGTVALNELKTWKFAFYNSEKPITNKIENAIRTLSNKPDDDMKDFFLIPNRYDLFSAEEETRAFLYQRLLGDLVSKEANEEMIQAREKFKSGKRKRGNK